VTCVTAALIACFAIAPTQFESNALSTRTKWHRAGKRKGTRNKVTLAVEALLDGEAETLTRKAIELATAGDLTALRHWSYVPCAVCNVRRPKGTRARLKVMGAPPGLLEMSPSQVSSKRTRCTSSYPNVSHPGACPSPTIPPATRTGR
jgi:hypothetical protein